MKFILVILFCFLFACSPSANKKVISGTVSYGASGGYGRYFHDYEFTQTNVDDSLYVLSYSRESINPSDSSRPYNHHYTFRLVPGDPEAEQTVMYNNTASSALWLLDSQTYRIERRDYAVYKYISNARADNFCIKADTRVWSPEFGMVIWDLPSEVMHTSPVTLVRPLLQQDSAIVAIMLDSLFHDMDFLRYPGASDKSTIKVCNIHTPPVDHPEKITNMREYVDSTVRYPQEAIDSCVSGTAYATIDVGTAGNIVKKDLRIFQQQFLNYNDAFERECWRVIESVSHFEPMTFWGRKVPTRYSIPLSFELPDPVMCEKVLAWREEKRKKEVSDDVFVVVETQPKFPGGDKALQQNIAKELKYPSEAKKDSVSGTVFVSFIVNKNGEIDEAKILERSNMSYQDLFETEALRAIKGMPEWSPGQQRGEAVRVRMVLPIKFEP